MRTALLRAGLVLYAVWLAAVVVFAASQLGLVPRFDAVHRTVVAGAVVLTVVGAVRILRRGYAAVLSRVGRDDGV